MRNQSNNLTWKTLPFNFQLITRRQYIMVYNLYNICSVTHKKVVSSLWDSYMTLIYTSLSIYLQKFHKYILTILHFLQRKKIQKLVHGHSNSTQHPIHHELEEVEDRKIRLSMSMFAVYTAFQILLVESKSIL